MVSKRILGLLGRASHSAKKDGMFALLRDHGNTPAFTIRHSRSKLPATPTRYNSHDNRLNREASYCSTKKANSLSRIARSRPLRQTQSRSPLRTRTRRVN